MTGRTPPHRTAQQKQRDRTPLARKLDHGQLAPAHMVPAVVCGWCNHPRLRVGCECAAYIEVADA